MAHSNDQISSRELSVILRELQSVLQNNVEGDITELGCYKGLTTLELQRHLKNHGSLKLLYAYDSFAGLPPKVQQDRSPAGEQFMAGELPASKHEIIKIFKQAGLRLPIIKKAWFSDLNPEDLPETIAFAFLDGDFYHSILDSLKLVWPRLCPGAVVIVDDYQNEALPGAAKATNEWLVSHPAHVKIEASLAIIRPKVQ